MLLLRLILLILEHLEVVQVVVLLQLAQPHILLALAVRIQTLIAGDWLLIEKLRLGSRCELLVWIEHQIVLKDVVLLV